MTARVCVIGGGPAGLSAAIYLGGAGLHPTVYCGLTHASQLSMAPEIVNFPGIEKSTGTDILRRMEAQAEKSGAYMADPSDVTCLKELQQGAWSVELDYDAAAPSVYDAVIVATGSNPRIPEIPGISDSVGNRVYTCATCDGGRHELDGTNVIVYGGGRSAVSYARYVKSAGKDRTVTVMCRHAMRDPTEAMLLSSAGITVMPDTVIKSVAHEPAGLHISGDTAGAPFIRDASAIFLAAGSVPDLSFMAGVRHPFSPGKLNKYGATSYVDEYEDRGLYMCGSVLNGFYGVDLIVNQAAVCSASGISSAMRLISAIQHGKIKENL